MFSAQRLLIISSIFMPIFAYALIDMRTANFQENWTDLQTKNTSFDLKVLRAYNSRSLFVSIFGFGWCSEYETNLKVTAENTLRVTECGGGFEMDYLPSNYSAKSADAHLQKLMAEVRRRNKGKDERYFKVIEDELKIDANLRAEYEKSLNITGRATEGSKYVNSGKSNDFIVLRGSEYVRTLPNNTYQKFNKAGQLIQFSDKNGNFVKINYTGGKVTSVTDNQGNSLQFKYTDNGKFVRQVNGPNGLVAVYKYKGENLVEVVNAWKKTYKYEYDDLYNMIKAIYPDKTTFELTYNKDKDWVMSFKDRRNCKEVYKYSDDEKDPINNYSSEVVKTCDGKITNTSSYGFWHRTNKAGVRYLAKSKSVINGKSVETIYHEEFGNPTEIITDGVVRRFSYFPNGLMKSKVEPNLVYNYKYENSCQKVSEVKMTATIITPLAGDSKKGDRRPSKVQTQTRTTSFKYDPRTCNLAAANSSNGQTVKLSYDMRGRISRILDQSKKEVTITYDERFGKPQVVSRPGLGTIRFKYKADGSMDKFDSNDDPLVALQVANVFSNLLEIIGPATTDSNNI